LSTLHFIPNLLFGDSHYENHNSEVMDTYQTCLEPFLREAYLLEEEEGTLAPLLFHRPGLIPPLIQNDLDNELFQYTELDEKKLDVTLFESYEGQETNVQHKDICSDSENDDDDNDDDDDEKELVLDRKYDNYKLFLTQQKPIAKEKISKKSIHQMVSKTYEKLNSLTFVAHEIQKWTDPFVLFHQNHLYSFLRLFTLCPSFSLGYTRFAAGQKIALPVRSLWCHRRDKVFDFYLTKTLNLQQDLYLSLLHASKRLVQCTRRRVSPYMEDQPRKLDPWMQRVEPLVSFCLKGLQSIVLDLNSPWVVLALLLKYHILFPICQRVFLTFSSSSFSSSSSSSSSTLSRWSTVSSVLIYWEQVWSQLQSILVIFPSCYLWPYKCLLQTSPFHPSLATLPTLISEKAKCLLQQINNAVEEFRPRLQRNIISTESEKAQMIQTVASVKITVDKGMAPSPHDLDFVLERRCSFLLPKPMLSFVKEKFVFLRVRLFLEQEHPDVEEILLFLQKYPSSFSSLDSVL
jgi:hypothetical protein